jgi:hypothetical protein
MAERAVESIAALFRVSGSAVSWAKRSLVGSKLTRHMSNILRFALFIKAQMYKKYAIE